MKREINLQEIQQLKNAAAEALKFSHSPYSNVKVGVAVLTDEGIVKGATVESCAYPTSVCGVRAAIICAIGQGAKAVYGLAVVTEGDTVKEPCGACLEFCREFGGHDVPIWMKMADEDKFDETRTSVLLPTYGVPQESPFLKGQGFEESLDFDTPFTMHPNVKVPTGMTEEEFVKLCEAAVRACKNAYVATSNFPVGAAVYTTDGRLVTGCNVEHAKIGLGICAERCALCRMIAQGSSGVKCLAVCCAKLPDYGRPCGGCRQLMVEFEDYPIYQLQVDWENRTIDVEPTTSLAILPYAFTPAALKL